MANVKPLVNNSGEINTIQSGDTVDPTCGGTGLSSFTTGYYINASSSTALQMRSPAQVLSDIGALAAATYTASDILTKLLTVDGSGSSLDADLLDGQHGAYFLDLANSTGTLADARLSSNVMLLNNNQSITGIKSFNKSILGDAFGTGVQHILSVENGSSPSRTSSMTGAIEIQLPGDYSIANMLSFTVSIFDYSTSESFQLYIGGYIYPGSGSGGYWVNQTAVILSQNINRKFTVRFGGTTPKIWIGELNSTWDYLSVVVSDINSSAPSLITSNPWNVALQTTAFENTPNGSAAVNAGNSLPVAQLSELATSLQTARTINGTSFNGTANITTANWGTSRTVTIGNTGKAVDGSANVTWTLAEIGAPSTTGSGASGTWAINITGSAAQATKVSINDTRAVTTTPETAASPGLYGDFKQNSAEGLSDGGTYFAELTLRKYGNTTDWSGGGSHQLGMTDNGNIWHRYGTNTTWGAWRKMWDDANDGAGSGLDADLLDGQQGTYYQDLTNSTGTLPTGRLPALTGDVTSPAGSATTTIAAGVVTLAKMANVATGTVFYRKTASTGAPEVQTLATLKADLGLTGTNSGDQTITLTGDVTGSGTGSFAATIGSGAVTLAKMANVATGTVFYRKTAATGAPEVQTLATLKTDLGLTGTNSGDQTITLTGDVTGSGTGSFAATIGSGVVSLAKMANVATGTVFYRKAAGTGAPEVQTLATLKTDLGLTGTNSGDQTITLTGDVTGSGTGSFAATIGSGTVTLAKMATLAANSFIGNNTGSTATPTAMTVAQAKTLLALVKGDVGLGNVENTALSTWAGSSNITTVGNISIPTGASAVTQASGTNSTTVATTAFVQAARNPRIKTQNAVTSFTSAIGSEDFGVITGLTAGLTINNPTGTPVDGQKLMYRIKDNGTARSLSFGAAFRGIIATLPTTTTASKWTYIGFSYNSTDSLWDMIAYGVQV